MTLFVTFWGLNKGDAEKCRIHTQNMQFCTKTRRKPVISDRFLELMTGFGPVNLLITNEVLYLLSYISKLFSTRVLLYYNCAKKAIGSRINF